MNSESEKFDAGVRKILSVSHDELKRREEAWQRERERDGKLKPGPKPKHPRDQYESLTSALQSSAAALQRIAESYDAPRPPVLLGRSAPLERAQKQQSLKQKRRRKSGQQK